MSWSLKVKNGDLVLGGAKGMEIVTNEAKMVQDLRGHLLEKMGSDELHPDFGSLLNGGITLDGFNHSGFIGEPNNSVTMMNIQSEVTRVINNYQQRVLNRAKADKMLYGKASLTHGEVVMNINDITIQSYLDQINIKISVTSGADQVETLTINI